MDTLATIKDLDSYGIEYADEKLAGKLLVNTLLGFALLGILSALGVLAKLSLGLNLFNALVIAVLGVPGLALLILLRLVFI